MNLGTKLSDFWRRFQGELFPALSEKMGPLLGTHRRFVAALDLVGVEGFVGAPIDRAVRVVCRRIVALLRGRFSRKPSGTFRRPGI